MANYITAGDPQNHTSADANSLTQVVDGPYWSSWADSLVPAGFGPQQTDDWRHKLATSQIVGVSEGCGRMQNRKLTLSDASQACARYRLNTDQIQGEIYSYYLSQVLGIQHVPPSVLVTTDSREERWRRVNKAVTDARWAADKVAIVTPWIGGLEPAYIPQALRHHDRHLHPSDVTKRTDLSQDAVRDLVQWSDLIVFDYLTANLDRVVNNMYNQQWNSEMMNSPAHNLERDPDTGLLVFMDNESGLFHSYRLLDKYGSYHQALLSSLCVFRRDTAQRVRALHDQGQGRLGALIMEAFREHEPLHKHVPKLPERTAAVLDQRLSDVYRQIQHCEGLYGS